MTIDRDGSNNCVVNSGMYELITRERKRLGIKILIDYDIWESEDRTLPEYKGYGYFSCNLSFGLFNNSTNMNDPIVMRHPTEEERAKLSEFGHDLISTMKLAALSIGSASVYGKRSLTDLSDLFDSPGADIFWLNVVQSWFFLGISSDRLRTFFVEIVLQRSERGMDKCLRKHNKNNQSSGAVYAGAFLDVDCMQDDREIMGYVAELKSLVSTIADIRLRRNAFVHQYTTREALMLASLRGGDHAGIVPGMAGDKDLSEYVAELVSGYKVIEKAGNLVFLIAKRLVELALRSALSSS
jgi:hypothetical protein